MDLNDFLICKNALNIRFSRDIVAQSHEDHFSWTNKHCTKSIQIRSFSWPVYSRIWIEYGKIWTRKKLRIWIFSRGEINGNYLLIPTSKENNLIYLFITQTPEGEIKTQFCRSLSHVYLWLEAAIINHVSREFLQCNKLSLGYAHINHGLLSRKRSKIDKIMYNTFPGKTISP